MMQHCDYFRFAIIDATYLQSVSVTRCHAPGQPGQAARPLPAMECDPNWIVLMMLVTLASDCRADSLLKFRTSFQTHTAVVFSRQPWGSLPRRRGPSGTWLQRRLIALYHYLTSHKSRVPLAIAGPGWHGAGTSRRRPGVLPFLAATIRSPSSFWLLWSGTAIICFVQ